MFKVTITNASKNLSWGGSFETELEAQEWLQKQIGKPNRLPERYAPKFDENNEPILDDSGEQVVELVPAEFVAEIIDLSKDNNWLYEQKAEQRRKLYPMHEEIIEALMEEKEGRIEKLSEVLAKRAQVKLEIQISDEIKPKKDK